MVMTEHSSFDVDAWLRRIGYAGPRAPTKEVLAALITAQTESIPFEGIDVFLGRVPALDLASLQAKLINHQRGGYCYEQNIVFRSGLLALGFRVKSLIARVVIGRAADAAASATHMALRVDLPGGQFLADVGFGSQTPTAPLMMQPDVEQPTPHEPMRLLAVGHELVLQAELDGAWANLYRLSPCPALDIDYEVANWFVAGKRESVFATNIVAARSAPYGVRHALLNDRLTMRQRGRLIERRVLADDASFAAVLNETFRLTLSDDDLRTTWGEIDRRGLRGAGHPLSSV